METKAIEFGSVPLSDDEARSYELLVERGREIREPILRRAKERHEANVAKLAAERAAMGRRFSNAGRRVSSKDSMEVVPDDVRRWVVLRHSGLSFAKAGEASGSTWSRVQEARAHSEEFRCAYDAMCESSRSLMAAKAMSVMEQSQEEGAKVSLPQAQLAMKILSSTDREHFGDDRGGGGGGGEDAPRIAGGGGFVINVIGDAAAVAAKPSGGGGRAIVYTDV